MSDDIESRLKSLTEILGKKVAMKEPPPELAKTVEPLADETDENGAQGGCAITTQATPPTQDTGSGESTLYTQTAQNIIASVSSSQAFDCSAFHVGKPVDEYFEFCPWVVVQNYPDFFIGKANRPRAQPFFKQILEGRVWDFFYIYDARKPSHKPHLLVPTAQFSAFLDGINGRLGIVLKIPSGVNEERFYLKFVGETPRPRYLMRNRDTKRLEVESWPLFDNEDATAYRIATGVRRHDYDANMDMMSKRHGADKSRAAELRAAQRKEHGIQMLQDAQLFLRLDGHKAGSDVVFLCFDAEAIERAPHPVSEIGVAVLDVQDIRDIEAGPSGRDWWPKIQAHHLRIKEYSGLINRRYVKGCPGSFDFGTSTFPIEAKIHEEVMSILEPYIKSSRKLVLVGHDFAQDVTYLSQVGVELIHLPNMICQVDSQVIHQCWRDSPSGRSLNSVLGDLCMASKNLHNAGNDAVYTLRAVIGVAIEQLREMEMIEKGEEYSPALWAE